MLGKSYNGEHAKGVFNTPWFSIEEIPSVSPTEEPYYSVSCLDSIAKLAQTLDSEFKLIRQFRPPQGQYTLELTSGYVDRAEANEAAVRRGFLEETGYYCEDIIYLGAF
jgi:8-oxo-dGTP pyrophosphatase MutT (NUDIX family)